MLEEVLKLIVSLPSKIDPFSSLKVCTTCVSSSDGVTEVWTPYFRILWALHAIKM